MIDSSKGVIYIFTEIEAWAGFFCSNPYSEVNFKLNDYNSAFQVEIMGIAEDNK